MQREPRAVLIVGAQAAGKSSVGRALAARFERAAFVEGDVIWKMVVSGAVDMSADPDPEAERQLALRYRNAALLCESFVAAGFVAVHAENMYGPTVADHLSGLRCPASLVVLRPSVEAIVRRERARATDAYGAWTRAGTSLRDAVARFDGWVGETPPIGLWIDTSALSVDETVDRILDGWEDAAVGDPLAPADPVRQGLRP